MTSLFKGLAALFMVGSAAKLFAPMFAGAKATEAVLRAGCPKGHWVGGKAFLVQLGGETQLDWALTLLVQQGGLVAGGEKLALFQPELEELQRLLSPLILAMPLLNKQDGVALCRATVPAVASFIGRLEDLARFSARKVWTS